MLLTLGTAMVLASSSVRTDPLTRAVSTGYIVPTAFKRRHGTPAGLKDPWSAVFWSLGTPMAMGLLASVPVLTGGFQPMAILGVLAPAGVVAGYLYAGDPGRGFWVGLGSYGASVVTGGLTVGVASALPQHGNLLMSGALPIWGGLAATTGWDIWSLRDVYGTAVRRNRKARGKLLAHDR